MYDSNPKELYKYLITKLSERQIAFLEIKEAYRVTEEDEKEEYLTGRE